MKGLTTLKSPEEAEGLFYSGCFGNVLFACAILAQ